MWLRGAPDRGLSVARYRRLAARYDDSCRYIDEPRRAALEALGDLRGRTVFDVACGTGPMLAELARRVGPSGAVVGIEHSPAMAGIARERVRGLQELVTVLETSVEEARPARMAEALLLCYTHDVLQSAAAVGSLFRYARPDARVVVIGNRFQPWWWAAPVNLWVILRGWRYHTTYRGFGCPWRPLPSYCPDLRVIRSFRLGMSYLAVGHFCARRNDSAAAPTHSI